MLSGGHSYRQCRYYWRSGMTAVRQLSTSFLVKFCWIWRQPTCVEASSGMTFRNTIWTAAVFLCLHPKSVAVHRLVQQFDAASVCHVRAPEIRPAEVQCRPISLVRSTISIVTFCSFYLNLLTVLHRLCPPIYTEYYTTITHPWTFYMYSCLLLVKYYLYTWPIA